MTRSRHHVAVLAVAVALSAAGCGGDTEAEPPAKPATTSASAATARPGPVVTDPLEPLPAEKMLALVGDVVRADDGTTLVVSSTINDGRSVYRLYDRRWAPLTPMLELRGALTVDRGLAHAFLGTLFAYRHQGQPRVDERVLIGSDGTLTSVASRAGRADEPVTTRSGDRRLASPQSGHLVYRPADRAVHRTTVPEWATPAHSWYVTAAGGLCVLDSRSKRASGTVHVSVDEGRTFSDVSTAGLPAGSGPRLQSCVTAGDRVVVMTGGEYPQWLHVLDRVSGAVLVSHHVGDQHGPYNPYDWHLLPDGKLVINSDRPGLYVATDLGNESLEFRPRPRVRGGSLLVVGDDLVIAPGGQQLLVSTDEGRTWETVQLS